MRFLQLQSRTLEAAGPSGTSFHAVDTLRIGDEEVLPWDEAVERETRIRVRIADLLDAEHLTPDRHRSIARGRGRARRRGVIGRIIRSTESLSGVVRLSAELLDGPSPLYRLSAQVENTSAWHDASAKRDDAVRHALVAAHVVLHAADARFISLLEPPEWARAHAASCANVGVWPVLVGDDGRADTMLASPIILYDYPRVAPESPGNLFDATEIDEILTLRTLALTDDEKREARATDPRAAAVIDRTDAMPQEMLDRLHGAIRYLRDVTGASSPPADAPWWDPGADASVSPDTDTVTVEGIAIAKGSRVRLCPGSGADAHDMFLAGKCATVTGVFRDVEENYYIAVTVDDDPAADLQQWHARYLYFKPEEIAPVEATV